MTEPRETRTTAVGDEGPLALAAALAGFQGLLFIITAVEAGFMAALSGNAAGGGPVVLSLGLAASALVAGTLLRKGRARRAVRFMQWALLAWAGIDLALSLWLVAVPLPLAAMISRIGLPVTVLALTRKKYA